MRQKVKNATLVITDPCYIKQGYEQAEKETAERVIDKAVSFFKANWRRYILGPDADGAIRLASWEKYFRKAMKEK